MSPVPLHRAHATLVTTWPRSDWRTRRCSPAPWQSTQFTGSVPGAVPRPAQAAHVAGRRTEISLRHPKTASAKLESEPDLGVGAGLGPAPPPAGARDLPEERLEDVAQVALEAEPAHAALRAEDAFGAVAVVAGPALGVAQHLVGDGHLLEPASASGLPWLVSGCSSRARAR